MQAERNDIPQCLYDWFAMATQLDCYGSLTVIKSIDIRTREVELPFRDGTVTMDFEKALECLKPATPHTQRGK